MKLYLDTADRGAAESLMATGLLCASREGLDPASSRPGPRRIVRGQLVLINKDAKRAITKATVDATRVTV